MNKHPRSSSTWIYRRKPPTCSIHHIITDGWGAQRGKKKWTVLRARRKSKPLPPLAPPPTLLYPTLLFPQFMSCAHKTRLTLLEATATPRWAFKGTVQKHTDLNLVHGGLGGGINEGRATFRAQFWGVTRQMQWRGTCKKKERKVSRDGGK